MKHEEKFVRGLGLFDSTMIAAGAMIGSGIFIVSAEISRQVGSPGSLLVVWLITDVISAALIFYILTVAEIYALRRREPDAERPYKAVGYPILPALYIIGASVILVVLFTYKTATTWPGLLIVLSGAPVYLFWRAQARKPAIAPQD